jgi:hypothetical protein
LKPNRRFSFGCSRPRPFIRIHQTESLDLPDTVLGVISREFAAYADMLAGLVIRFVQG